jgi:hypothetical protein
VISTNTVRKPINSALENPVATRTARQATAFQTETKTRTALSNLLRTMTSRLTPHPLTITEMMVATIVARRMEDPRIAAVMAVTVEMGITKARSTRNI